MKLIEKGCGFLPLNYYSTNKITRVSPSWVGLNDRSPPVLQLVTSKPSDTLGRELESR